MTTEQELARTCIESADMLDEKRRTLADGDPNITMMRTQSDELRLKAETLITEGVAEGIGQSEKIKTGLAAATKIATEASTKIANAKQIVGLTGSLLSFVGAILSGDLTGASNTADTLISEAGKLLQ